MAKKKSATTTAAAPPPEGSFIFRGTVQRAKDSTVPDITPNARTCVVRIDEVIAAPPALARMAGREVTVIGTRPMKQGEQAMFHTGSVSFGQEVAVRAVQTEPLAAGASSKGFTAARAAAAPLAATSTAAVDPVQAHRDLLLKRSLDSADVVVAGTIVQVRMAPETQALASPATSATGVRLSAARRRLAAGPAPGASTRLPRITEHDPLWHEAVVNVESVEKGSTGQKQIVVRFPGSNDVRWRNHPKLRPGQQGVFLLSEPAEAGPGDRALSARRRAGVTRLTTMATPLAQSGALQAMTDPQPIVAIDRVRQLLNQPSPAARVTTGSPRGPVRASRSRKTPRKRRSKKG